MPQNFQSRGKIGEFCCVKFIFSQFEDPNFESFPEEHATTHPVNGVGVTVELNLSLEKSGNSVLTGE